MITLVKFCKIISRYRFAFSATNRDRAAFKTQLRPAPPSCLRTTPRWLRNSRDRAQSSSVRKQATAMQFIWQTCVDDLAHLFRIDLNLIVRDVIDFVSSNERMLWIVLAAGVAHARLYSPGSLRIPSDTSGGLSAPPLVVQALVERFDILSYSDLAK